jgi:hypothetical protein
MRITLSYSSLKRPFTQTEENRLCWELLWVIFKMFFVSNKFFLGSFNMAFPRPHPSSGKSFLPPSQYFRVDKNTCEHSLNHNSLNGNILTPQDHEFYTAWYIDVYPRLSVRCLLLADPISVFSTNSHKLEHVRGHTPWIRTEIPRYR